MNMTTRHENGPLRDERSASVAIHTTVAAVFADRERAHDAIHELRDDGFRDTWIGITRRDESYDYDQTPAAYADTERVASLTTLGEPLGGAVSAYDAPPPGWSGGSADDVGQSTRVESDNWFMRFFGEGDQSLHDALVRRGVTEADARAAGELPEHSAIVTVDGANHPEMAAEILSQFGGRLITRGFGASGYGTEGTYAPDASTAFAERSVTPVHENGRTDGVPRSGDHENSTAFSERTMTPEEEAREEAYAPRSTRETAQNGPGRTATGANTGSDRIEGATAYDDYGRFRGGSPIDESTRLQLRQERLRVDKSRVSRGDAAISTDVLSESQEVDIPVVREDVFIERRRVDPNRIAGSADRTSAGAPSMGNN